MAYWLATAREGQDADWIQRFDPRFWTINFPRPMMAAVVVTAPDALRVDASFLRVGDLAGLIWDSQDLLDHPLLSYATDRDYARTTLTFRWRSGGIIALDAVNGPTLTIEGKDAAGALRSWYVRLWHYAVGTPSDAEVTLPFSALAGGWVGDGDAVYPSSIDRMFISMVPPGYVAGSTAPLPAATAGWAELSAIRCEGHRAMLEIGDVIVPPHGIAAATAYDDSCNQTPQRMIRNLRQLGYRGSVLHYAGMSHYPRLGASGVDFFPVTTGNPLCTPAQAWHRAFFTECKASGFAPITSLSYELLAMHCPAAWQQRASNGDPARTGWDPPSALLSPANGAAMAWLGSVAAAFVMLMAEAGVALRFQIGEPWWWIMADGRPCLYDDAAKAALGGNPPVIADMRQSLSAAKKTLLDSAGSLLASSTAAIAQAVRTAAAPKSVEVLLLAFLPSVLDPAMPDAQRANLPIGWGAPAFDRLQLEDYDWLTAGADAHRLTAYQTVNQRLGYSPSSQDYLAGFVAAASLKDQWRLIDAAIDEARVRNAHEIFVWASPQICRDGYVRLPNPSAQTQGSDDMLAFDNVPYPLALGRDATITPEFSTSVSVTASGFERRNSLWSNARLRFDVGPGIRSEAELGVLLAFFRARRGAARGFRLRDPSDFSSNAMIAAPTMADQIIGTGNGIIASFPLIKRYGDGSAVQLRRITRPRAETLLISVGGVAMTGGWTLGESGMIIFTAPPAANAIIRAGFLFDVPVRFADDKLEISGAAFAAGEAPSVPIIEIREAP